MSRKTLNLDDAVYDYLLLNSLRETDVQRRLRELTAAHPGARMQIAPEQGQFMAVLAELIGARQMLEIGTFTGYSALWLAQAVGERGRLVCCDINREWTAIGEPYWREAGLRERIELRIAPALETLQVLLDDGQSASFDLAFIDADKENYPSYYELCLQLVRPGGVVLLDNTLWGGAVADRSDQDPDTRAIREMNERLHRDQRVSLSLVPIGDGLTVVRKR